MISTLVIVMGMTSWGQMALEMSMLSEMMHTMGNQQEVVYNYWCDGVRCDEYGHDGYEGIPEDCTTEEEENGSCGFGLVQP
jgi:hypothetical protein|tara:strand:+ start:6718 stop:6960 length:243 start_codon:yes stop_codon:yes gene_type:complete